MIEIEIDGQQLQVPEGYTVMDAANKIGAYIPHFCYHKKLSIAANCRMCLVQVEKAPKPLPACATPVANGMKVQTHSQQAVKAQKGVIEFLLINHPLDCPICDQGGECQLQDLAVGYGASGSRYVEEKRVVMNKNLGALISTDMTRCIHCTRCVRFGQEIAGVMELGMAGRGEHSEILTFVGKTVDSELSGNMIDLCPVGALTSKPFRFAARTWELSRRRAVSPHDGLGANLIVQVKHDRVMRVLPLENEEVNECWLSDRDRFSYEGLNSEERLTRPMLKQGGVWQECDWQTALEYVAHGLSDIRAQQGAQSIGALASPHSTLEELYLLQKLMRGLGSENIDFRLRQSDFSTDGQRRGAPWLGMKISEIGALDRVLVVGSFLRQDHPLITQRLRQIAKRGAQISLIHPSADDLLLPVFARAVVSPAAMAATLAQVLKAVAVAKGATLDPALERELAALEISAEVGKEVQRIADSLVTATNGALLLGNLAQQHPQAATLHQLAQELARIAGIRFGFLGEAANSVGGYVVGAAPTAGGLNARQMFERPLKAYVLLHAEPELDCYNPRQALAALEQAKMVVVASPFKGSAMSYADVLLPVAPFSETSGAFVNTEGRVQSFNAVVKPLGETRPAWKVLRVLGNLLNLPGFDFDSSEAVRRAIAGTSEVFAAGLDNALQNSLAPRIQTGAPGVQRVTDVPIYFADPLVRRAASLQKTRAAAAPVLRLNTEMLRRLGIKHSSKVRVRQGSGEAMLEAVLDDSLATGCVSIAAGHPLTASLGGMLDEISVEAL